MNIGVIGSGSIGPDLAYGFISALAKGEGGKVYLVDIRQEALDAGMQRIRGYMDKGLARGKLSPKAATTIEAGLIPTMKLGDLADCDYVLEAATEDLSTKRVILRDLEKVVRKDCLIGFATSGIPRAQIASEVAHPQRCFVNHPFFPAWRALPIEVVLSGDAKYDARMLGTLQMLGKVPIVTTDVPCFAADDIFVNYCAEAARIAAEGTATPAQVDAIVNGAIGGGGPFNVMDLTRGNLLNVHCMELMKAAPTGGDWFTPPPIFTKVGNDAWHDRKNPGDPTHDDALKKEVLDRILAVLIARTYFVVDNGICDPTELNWLTKNALGFGKGLLDLTADLGADRARELCSAYAAKYPGFTVPESIASKKLVEFNRTLKIERDGDIAVVTIFRPEVKNALNATVIDELDAVFSDLATDDAVGGVVLTSVDGSLAGADIMELAALKTPDEAQAKSRHGQAVLDRISALEKPVVAALDGPVLGGGAELSMSCHARVVGRGLMLGQPEVNLGIIPGYGGSQRLPRLIGLERGVELLRTGRPVFAKHACEWGWAEGEPVPDPVEAAKALIKKHLDGQVKLARVNPDPMVVPDEFPPVFLGHRSLAIDSILVDVIRTGLANTLAAGNKIEAAGFARCKQTVDYDIGMKNFIQNGPRVPAVFLNE
jgi:enoyl-CoA hydratase/3-hydroxyacyl-CoA dehydrogenase